MTMRKHRGNDGCLGTLMGLMVIDQPNEINNKTHISEVKYNNSGNKMVIIKYTNSKNVLISFKDYNYQVNTTYKYFRSGSVSSPYDKTCVGVGFSGEGKYQYSIDKTKTKQFIEWQHMLRRCYDKIYLERFPTYKDCTVCEEWHNFQNFARWFDENYYEINNEKICLDKDILIKGNKLYSPGTCCFVPEKINNIFLKSGSIRGEYPIGVTKHKPHDEYITKYRARSMDNNGKRKDLGLFNTPEDAFQAYKIFKENLIKNVADKYKNYISQKIYDIMYKYIVNIND